MHYADGTYRTPDGRLVRQVQRGSRKRKFDYVLKIERLLGHELQKGVEIHHIDDNPSNDTNSNLVVCENRAYHRLLHFRQRILSAGGDPDKDRICTKCGQVKEKENFYFHKSGRQIGNAQSYCKACSLAYKRKRI